MAEDAEIDWRAIARKRWPLFKIQGDGPFVALPRGEDVLYLFGTVFERTREAPPNSEFVTLHLPERTQKAGTS